MKLTCITLLSSVMIVFSLTLASAQENVTRPAVRIAFISFNQLYIADGDGLNLQKISIGLYQPQWSPDGSHLAFFSHACGETWALCLVDAEGENLQDVVSGLHIPETLFWSPDGEVIAYAARGENGNANIYTVRSDGTELKRITDCSECRHSVISWSPDGRQIAILSEQGTAPNGRVMSNIYVVNKDGSNLRQVTNCNECAYYQSVVWSPDSTKIAFVAYESGRKLYMANLDKGSLRLLSDNYGDSIIWSQDSTSIGAITNEGICLLLEGECLVCDCGQVWSGNHPLLSSDGSQILFNSREQIHVIDIDGSNEKQLTFDENPLGQLGASIGPVWSPDGNHIAFRSTREGRWALYVMNADGSGVSKIADEVGWFAWQPLQINEEIDT